MSKHWIQSLLLSCAILICASVPSQANVEASLVGTILNSKGLPSTGAEVDVRDLQGTLLKSVTSSAQGDYIIFPLPFGNYNISVLSADKNENYQSVVDLASSGTTRLDAKLQAVESSNSNVIAVVAHKLRINEGTSVSSQETNQQQIAQLPGGATQSLPKLLYTTNPGFVEGSFGQVFARGNHANLQYDIDGVQLPDSVSGTFGDAFSVQDIDRMEVITGGMPAEYGNRLSGVVNIITKSGQVTPGGTLDLNYGSYNTYHPELTYGGSNALGNFHYLLSGGYESTSRGLDTPEPSSTTDQAQGGTAAIHDHSVGNNQFGKFDWNVDDQDKLSLTVFNEQKTFQIPTYPSTFLSSDPFFQPGYTDAYENPGAAWTPTNTDDYQIEANDYAEVTWDHTFTNDSLLQLSPYWKMSSVIFDGDPSNDLAAATNPSTLIPQSNPSSFSEDRSTNSAGLQGDYTLHANESNVVKTGFQLQGAEAHGPVDVMTASVGGPVITSDDNSSDHDYQESVYLQDDFTFLKTWTLNAGLRYDAIQDLFSDASSIDGELQPRIGLNYMLTDTSKLHVFYGKLFQPAPAEDLRDTFANLGQGQLTPYDIKAEKDDYYEAGLAQQIKDQLISLNSYYKNAVNLLDDTQLLNTAITEPYNYAQGFVYGTELSINGKFGDHVSDFLSYSYEIAQGNGVSGGIFALPPGTVIPDTWNYLDHCQINTANAGLNYSLGGMALGLTGLYGSGLRTGPDNSLSLPSHFTMDGTASYTFKGSHWIEDTKVTLDVTNIFNNIYPIFIDNGYNGSHYEAGTGFMIHIIKSL